MRLVLLGTNGFHPTDDGQTACYMLPDLGIVLDAGSGMHRVSNYLKTTSLDIYLSHAHSDHYLGLFYLIGAVLKKLIAESGLPVSDETIGTIFSEADAFMSRVCIHGSVSTLADVQKHDIFDSPEVRWLPLAPEEQLPGRGKLTHFPLEHSVECHGFRLDWPGHSLAYVTDTVARSEAPYVEKIAGVDVLLHECFSPNNLAKAAESGGHSYTAAVAQVAVKANVRRLVLIHHNTFGLRVGGAELEHAREIFSATEVGLDGMEIDF
jgi:ribonuclease BN (tRNA processing enzyme)